MAVFYSVFLIKMQQIYCNPPSFDITNFRHVGLYDTTLELIMEACAIAYDTTLLKMKAGNRTKQPKSARRLYFFICKRITNETTVSLGKQFGLDHSTVIYHQQRMAELIDLYKSERDKYDRAMSIISAKKGSLN